MIRWTTIALILGFLADLALGDPCWLYHPVRLIGAAITFLEKRLRSFFPKTEKGERAAGFVLVIGICFFSAAIPLLVLSIAFHIHTFAGIAAETFLCYQMLAVKSLKTESMKVYQALEKKDLEGARHAVSMIVGRDTASLDEEGVTKAAVETVAENASDGIIAPLFYMALGGPGLMWLYKGINTMDSMVAYKNEKYLYFGRCAAKLDDLANFIPARLSAFFMILGAFLAGFNGKNAAKIFKRDRFNHASPNSAQTEAVMAGALEIRLAGNAFYFGKLYEKPTIGDAVRPVQDEDIKRANRLLYVSAALSVLVFATVRQIVWMFCAYL